MGGIKCFRCGQWDGEACSCSDGQTLFHGDAREVLRELGPIVFDCTITDPPYSSGGAMRSDRNLQASEKYRQTNVEKIDPEFTGDNRDQRAFTLWCSDWIAAAFWRTRPGGGFLAFIDWRNLPCMIDAVQVGGFVYRAIIPWDKTDSCRPNRGWFRAQCEYVVGASAGTLSQGADCPDGIASPGFFEVRDQPEEDGEPIPAGLVRWRVVGREKLHLTEKPVGLIESLLRTRGDWRTILDPFAGSGTTLQACKNLGLRGIGIEASREYCGVASRRLSQGVLFAG